MPGSPKKRARRLGLAIPNAGDKPPSGRPALHPRARARDPQPKLPALLPDAELEALAKRTLTAVMQGGADDKDRVAAARAMLEARRRAGSPSEDPLERLTAEELEKLEAKAEAILGGPVQ